MHFTARQFLILAELALVLICASFLFNVAPDTVHAVTTTKTTVTVKKPVVPAPVVAKTNFEISGWIPYWRTATGTADVLPHLSQMTEVNPFGYTVKLDGSLNDAAGIGKGTWDTFIAAARAKKVRIIPTVMWSDTESIHNILSNPTLRASHEDAIVAMVYQNNFDGVDIDYEGKRAEDRANYAAFLKELYTKMGKKWVSCTIEARTPPDSLYSTIPANLEYANDLTAVNKYCDRVKLMTYDQESADIKLNKAATGLYTPIADPAWITKVITLMSKDIAKSKIEIGVATYGYIYQVMPQTDGTYDYTLLEAFNPRYATDLAASLGITPTRNSAGELSFTYVPTSLSNAGLQTQAQLSAYAPAGTPTSLLAAVGATKLATSQNKQSPFYLLWWSDSKAIADKVALAKKLGVRGVAVFKMDGGEDPLMWSVLK
ncbi:MAG: putative peptidoglycan hydrolase YvbX, involved in spore germination [Parcubacteria group bacterium]|nr:putative peptidoglycan hydrolase YvbX, involved in spore germination [Parcubacteria group bacterium]